MVLKIDAINQLAVALLSKMAIKSVIMYMLIRKIIPIHAKIRLNFITNSFLFVLSDDYAIYYNWFAV